MSVEIIDQPDDRVDIIISDNAGGISDEVIGRVFDPYFTTKEQGKGVGIGLYMAKEIIERHMGGKIYCENTDVGVRFVVEVLLNYQ